MRDGDRNRHRGSGGELPSSRRPRGPRPCQRRRREFTAPTLYPVACAPQAWASACVFALVEACLGLQFDHQAGELRLNCPVLPGFLEHLQLRGLRLNGASADVLLHRISGEATATVTHHQGDLPVVVTY